MQHMRLKEVIVAFIVLTGLLFSATNGSAARIAKMRQACGNCHTMHDSSAGGAVAVAADGSTKIGPQQALVNTTCSGCHKGDNAAGSMPYVFNVGVAPVYNPLAGTSHATLAGGNFYWVANGADLKGHNVDGIVATQATRTPPGGSKEFNSSTPLSCAGVNGCHGDENIASQIDSVWGSHHNNGAQPIDGLTIATSYRFLNGITGAEDSDWEYSLSSTVHNQYKGVDRTADNDIGNNQYTISHLCARCHGDFHSDKLVGDTGTAATAFQSPWIRHPVDIDMGDATGSEYTSYGGAGVNAYMVNTPLADDNVSDVTTMFSSVTLGGVGVGDAIITCITCHRAHGSPWDYTLRWNYQLWPGGPDEGGCYNCHAAKN